MKTQGQTLISEARRRMGEKYLNERRFNALMSLIVGNKWNDIAFLADFKPKDEKYISRESLIKVLDHL